MTWRTTEDLPERVRLQAREQGRSLNDWVTLVLRAASDPQHAGDQAQQVRERLRRAGLLELPDDRTARRAPDAARLTAAPAAAGRGTPLSEVVTRGRR